METSFRCACGGKKQERFPSCYKCFIKDKKECMTCGRYIKSNFSQCYDCNKNHKGISCIECQDTGEMYLSDDVYVACMNCRGKAFDELTNGR